MRSETIELNGNPFFVRRWGDETLPPLLLLHGFPEYGGAWADFAACLQDRFHCIAPDQRGYGQSWAPPEVRNYTLPELVGDMAALVEAEGRGAVTVMGHDWGAAVAYGLAMFRPDLTERLIIANGVHPAPFQASLAKGGAQTAASQYIPFLRRPDSHEILAANDFEKFLALFSANMDLSWMTKEMQEDYKTEWKRGDRFKTMVHWYRASPIEVPKPGETLQNPPVAPKERLMVNCPHLLIWADGDTALLPESTEGLEDYAPDLTRVTVEGADHWLLHQKPQEVARIVRDWMPPQSAA